MGIKYQRVVIFVQDILLSRQFYEGLLGQDIGLDFGQYVEFKEGFALWQVDFAFQVIFERPSEGIKQLGRQNCELYFETPNIEDVSSHLAEAGVEFIHPLREHPWGQRALLVCDPDGHIVELSEPMCTTVQRFLNNGFSIAAVAERTAMPVDFVKQIADMRHTSA